MPCVSHEKSNILIYYYYYFILNIPNSDYAEILYSGEEKSTSLTPI